MDLQLANKRALTTGSTSGMGAETARMFAAEGAQVVVHGRNRDRAQAVANAPRTETADYSAAKGAINNLTLSLSKALAGTGVTSNGIMPGLIHTALSDPYFVALAKQQGSDDPQVGIDFALKNVLQQTVARVGLPRDIAAAVCFVASPLSDFMTGTTLRIDGGATPTI
jgi:3-oxoacyl-[acyl-carrier protein] reductase